MLANKDTVAKLIPQKPPMVMVHELIGHDEAETITAFTVEEGNIFVEKGLFSEAGLIENMAQSAALRTGWVSAMVNENEKEFTPLVGVIGAIKNFELLRLPEVNSRLITTIELLTEFGTATMVKAYVRKEEELLASADLKIFLTENRED
jgi:predicted hotdog family 3-hydroxylacyl-ACP dehydratase